MLRVSLQQKQVQTSAASFWEAVLTYLGVIDIRTDQSQKKEASWGRSRNNKTKRFKRYFKFTTELYILIFLGTIQARTL